MTGPTHGKARGRDTRELLTGHLVPSVHTDDESRTVRIAEEALVAFGELSQVGRAVSVFGSARAEPVDRWGDLARRTSADLFRAGFAVITGGGPS